MGDETVPGGSAGTSEREHESEVTEGHGVTVVAVLIRRPLPR